MNFEKLRNIKANNIFAILIVISVIFIHTGITYYCLMFAAKLISYLFRMLITGYQGYIDLFFYLFSYMLVGSNFDRLNITFMCAVIRGTERTLVLTFDNNFFVLGLYHL